MRMKKTDKNAEKGSVEDDTNANENGGAEREQLPLE